MVLLNTIYLYPQRVTQEKINGMEGNNSNSSALLNMGGIKEPLSLTLIIANVVFGIVGLTIVTLNSIVILGFIKERKVREAPGNVFIQNLATSDFFSGIFACYVAVLNIRSLQNPIEFRLRMGFICAFLVTSVFFVNYLTIDRYLKVAMHLRYAELVTTRTHHVLCIVTWIICIILGFLPLMGWHKPNVNSFRFLDAYPSSYIYFYFTVGMVSVFCMIVAYTKLYLISRHHRRRIEGTHHGKDGTKTNELRKASEIMCSIFLLIGAFLCCWLPVGLYSVVGASQGGDPSQTSFPVFTFLVTLGCMNSLLNPIIYAAKVEGIRDFFRKVCCSSRRVSQPVGAFTTNARNVQSA